jgi:Ca2+/Na+ antiporter
MIGAAIGGVVFLVGLVIGIVCLVKWIKKRDKGPKRIKRS